MGVNWEHAGAASERTRAALSLTHGDQIDSSGLHLLLLMRDCPAADVGNVQCGSREERRGKVLAAWKRLRKAASVGDGVAQQTVCKVASFGYDTILDEAVAPPPPVPQNRPTSTSALPDVTLIAVDCVNPALAAVAMQLSMRGLAFGAAKLLSDRRPDNLPSGVEFVPIEPLTFDGYNTFCLRDLCKHVGTTHSLMVHSDGYVLNPELWKPEWLQYDYVGAPWKDGFPVGHQWPLTGNVYDAKLRAYSRVGNSGFCLRSRRLLKLTSVLATDEVIEAGHAGRGRVFDDVVTCCDLYEALKSRGVKFAPVEAASDFSECSDLPSDYTHRRFGFHGKRSPRTIVLPPSGNGDAQTQTATPRPKPLPKRLLPAVTLACIDGGAPDQSAAAMAWSMKRLDFAAAMLFAAERPKKLPPAVEFVELPPFDTDTRSEFVLRQLHRYITTDRVLTVQQDGYVIRPGLWDDGWLKWDYIGATLEKGMLSGFCLRSRELLKLTAALATDAVLEAGRSERGRVFDDVVTCRDLHDALVCRGIQFAPAEVADAFAVYRTEDVYYLDDTFGFFGRNCRHAICNGRALVG